MRDGLRDHSDGREGWEGEIGAPTVRNGLGDHGDGRQDGMAEITRHGR